VHTSFHFKILKKPPKNELEFFGGNLDVNYSIFKHTFSLSLIGVFKKEDEKDEQFKSAQSWVGSYATIIRGRTF